MVWLDSWIDTGVPVASGTTARTAVTNLRNISLSLALPAGKISARAEPSGATQARTRSGGRSAMVTVVADRVRRSWRNWLIKPLKRTVWIRSTTVSGEAAV